MDKQEILDKIDAVENRRHDIYDLTDNIYDKAHDIRENIDVLEEELEELRNLVEELADEPVKSKTSDIPNGARVKNGVGLLGTCFQVSIFARGIDTGDSKYVVVFDPGFIGHRASFKKGEAVERFWYYVDETGLTIV